ncbi:MAG: transketolase [Pirellulales bacterium]|nr:transketolase [Pirellulales bacterium]
MWNPSGPAPRCWVEGSSALKVGAWPQRVPGTVPPVTRFPERLARPELYAAAYPWMAVSRRLEEQLIELFQKGLARGTVTLSIGNEATTVGMALPLRPKRDVVSLLHRDFGAHLVLGTSPYAMVCQYLANADSPTHGREGNVHHGDANSRRFPMMSHLGKMLSLVVGGTWAARRHGEEVFGLAVIGDGGSSTGEFHEALNLAAVQRVPVLFLVENNHYSFSTPTHAQYRCRRLSDRSKGYGIPGRTIDGTDPWKVYSAVWDSLAAMAESPGPVLLECMSIRLRGHAAYDKAEYVSGQELEKWLRRDPLPSTRRQLLEISGFSEARVAEIEADVEEQVRAAVADALRAPRCQATSQEWRVFAESSPAPVKPFRMAKAKNGEAVQRALAYLLENSPRALLAGLDVGRYGSAFKTCKGLFDRFGADRVIDMPLCESAIMGFALGASQVGAEPIIEFQFADFSTETVSQLGLNAGTWYFRTGQPAPILVRLPCGGGLTMGAFHSGEYEGLWSQFPGLKLLYPATPQETFEALVAGFYDRNPCLVFEHKLLYWSTSGPIDFDGDLTAVWRPRRYAEGSELTLVAFGAMVPYALTAAEGCGRSVEVWNPFVLEPMDLGPICESVEKTGRLLVVQECGPGQGLGNRVIAEISRSCAKRLRAAPRLIAGKDMPVPFATELESYFRPNAERIAAGIAELTAEDRT